jgi:hypothetical protein
LLPRKLGGGLPLLSMPSAMPSAMPSGCALIKPIAWGISS